MNDILKFVSQLNTKQQQKLWQVIDQLKQGIKNGKKLKGYKDLFSYRMGKFRIIYYKTQDQFHMHDIHWRNQVYKRLENDI